MRIHTTFYTDSSVALLENQSTPVCPVLVGLGWAPSKLAPVLGILANGPGSEWATQRLRLTTGHPRTGPWRAATEASREKLLPQIYSSCSADKTSVCGAISLSPITSVQCTLNAVVYCLLGGFFTCWTEGKCKSARLHRTLKFPATPGPDAHLEDKQTSSLSFMHFRAIKKIHPGNSPESNVESAANYKNSLQVVEHFPLADF